MATFQLETRGATAPLWSLRSDAEALQSLRDLKASGGNTVIIDFHLQSDGLSASSVRWQDPAIPSQLARAVRLANEAGLDVWIKPIVIIGRDGLNWQQLDPADKAAWFASYRQCILEAVQIAGPSIIDGVLLTNELATLTTNSANQGFWGDIITAVRSATPASLAFNAGGLLGEAPGKSEFERIPKALYDKVDFVGISAYPRIIGNSIEEYVRGWKSDYYGRNLIEIIRNFAETNGKKIIFTELGSPAISKGNIAFTDGTNLDVAATDQIQSRLFFQAALQTISAELSGPVAGVLSYAWSMTNDASLQSRSPWLINLQTTREPLSSAFTQGVDIVTGGTIGARAGSIYGTALADSIQVDSNSQKVISYAGNDVFIFNNSPAGRIISSISVTVASEILEGVAAVLNIYVSGEHVGTAVVQPIIGGRNASFGNIAYTTDQTFTVNLRPGTRLESVEIRHTNDEFKGFGLDRNALVKEIKIDGEPVNLALATYFPQNGLPFSSNGMMADGGRLVITPEKGPNPSFDGGVGRDTVVIPYSKADISVSVNPSGSDTLKIGNTLTIALHNIERVQLSNAMLALDVEANAGQAYRIYQAAFNRTPDVGGLTFWTRQIDAGASLVDVARGFLASDEARSVYGVSPSNNSFVDLLYKNVLGRAGENAGFAFWTGQLDAGLRSRADVLAGFSESAENIARVGPSIASGIWLDLA